MSRRRDRKARHREDHKDLESYRIAAKGIRNAGRYPKPFFETIFETNFTPPDPTRLAGEVPVVEPRSYEELLIDEATPATHNRKKDTDGV